MPKTAKPEKDKSKSTQYKIWDTSMADRHITMKSALLLGGLGVLGTNGTKGEDMLEAVVCRKKVTDF